MPITRDDIVRALAIRGEVVPDQLPESLVAESGTVSELVDELVAERVAEKPGGQIRLSASGKLAATQLFAADRASVGDDRAAQLLEQFHELDGRMKALVTAWQVRDVGGEQVLNDHTDAAYDERILGDLAALHGDTVTFLEPLTSMRRFAVYSARLSRALDAARTDQRYVASPRVDSYHSVWFELHEDLIRLAGKKRSEATAG